MKRENYSFRKSSKKEDIDRIKTMMELVFVGENISDLIDNSIEGLWYFIEDDSSNIISALISVPWKISLDGKTLNVWEQGIVGSLPKQNIEDKVLFGGSTES